LKRDLLNHKNLSRFDRDRALKPNNSLKMWKRK